MPQGTNTPGVAEGPRGDETLGGTTAAQDRRGEDGQGRGGGDENPPTARATRMQGADGGDGALRGGQRMAEPPVPMETTEEDDSVGPWQEQSDGVDDSRSEHGTLARREYDILESDVAEGVQANAGAASVEDGHGESVY